MKTMLDRTWKFKIFGRECEIDEEEFDDLEYELWELLLYLNGRAIYSQLDLLSKKDKYQKFRDYCQLQGARSDEIPSYNTFITEVKSRF